MFFSAIHISRQFSSIVPKIMKMDGLYANDVVQPSVQNCPYYAVWQKFIPDVDTAIFA